MEEIKSKSKVWYRKWWGWLGILFLWPFLLIYWIWNRKWDRKLKVGMTVGLLIVYSSLYFVSQNLPKPQQSVIVTPTISNYQTTPSPTPEVSFANSEVTEHSVRSLLEKRKTDLSSDFEQVEVVDHLGTEKPDDKIVRVYYYPKKYGGYEDLLMNQTVNTAVEIMEPLFSNPQVENVVVLVNLDFVDAYGNQDKSTAVRVGFERPTAEKVDWQNMKYTAGTDYNKLFDIADHTYIHPGIRKNL